MPEPVEQLLKLDGLSDPQSEALSTVLRGYHRDQDRDESQNPEQDNGASERGKFRDGILGIAVIVMGLAVAVLTIYASDMNGRVSNLQERIGIIETLAEMQQSPS